MTDENDLSRPFDLDDDDECRSRGLISRPKLQLAAEIARERHPERTIPDPTEATCLLQGGAAPAGASTDPKKRGPLSATSRSTMDGVELQIETMSPAGSRALFWGWYTILVLALILQSIVTLQWDCENMCGGRCELLELDKWRSGACLTRRQYQRTVPINATANRTSTAFDVVWAGSGGAIARDPLSRFVHVLLVMPRPNTTTLGDLSYNLRFSVTVTNVSTEEVRVGDLAGEATLRCPNGAATCDTIILNTNIAHAVTNFSSVTLIVAEAPKEVSDVAPSAGVSYVFQKGGYTIGTIAVRYVCLFFSLLHLIRFVSRLRHTDNLYEQTWVGLLHVGLIAYLDPLFAGGVYLNPTPPIFPYIEFRAPTYFIAVFIAFMYSVITSAMAWSTTDVYHPPWKTKIIPLAYIATIIIIDIVDGSLADWHWAAEHCPDFKCQPTGYVLYILLAVGVLTCTVWLRWLRNNLGRKPYLESRPQQLACRVFIFVFTTVVVYLVVQLILVLSIYRKISTLVTYQILDQISPIIVMVAFTNIMTFVYTTTIRTERVPLRPTDPRWRRVYWDTTWYQWLSSHGGSMYMFTSELDERFFYYVQERHERMRILHRKQRSGGGGFFSFGLRSPLSPAAHQQPDDANRASANSMTHQQGSEGSFGQSQGSASAGAFAQMVQAFEESEEQQRLVRASEQRRGFEVIGHDDRHQTPPSSDEEDDPVHHPPPPPSEQRGLAAAGGPQYDGTATTASNGTGSMSPHRPGSPRHEDRPGSPTTRSSAFVPASIATTRKSMARFGKTVGRFVRKTVVDAPAQLLDRFEDRLMDFSAVAFHVKKKPFFNLETAVDCFNLSWEAYGVKTSAGDMFLETGVNLTIPDMPDIPPVMNNCLCWCFKKKKGGDEDDEEGSASPTSATTSFAGSPTGAATVAGGGVLASGDSFATSAGPPNDSIATAAPSTSGAAFGPNSSKRRSGLGQHDDPASKSRTTSTISVPQAPSTPPINVEQYGYELIAVFEALDVQVIVAKMVTSVARHCEKGPRLIVSFRGTDNASNAKMDVKISRTRWTEMTYGGWGPLAVPTVHAGFLAIWSALRGCVLNEVADIILHQPEGTAPFRVAVTGHSLGGALAVLCAYSLKKTLKIPAPTVYTFGQPRVGNKAFQTEYNKQIPETFRVVNESDVVSSVTMFGGCHVGTEVNIDRNGNFVCEPMFIERTLRPTKGKGSGIANHGMSAYGASLNAIVDKGFFGPCPSRCLTAYVDEDRALALISRRQYHELRMSEKEKGNFDYELYRHIYEK